MSSPADLRNLVAPAWRARMAVAVAEGVEAWAAEDAVRARRLRR
jgi:N-acetylmuramoyl-L-alanine amidase